MMKVQTHAFQPTVLSLEKTARVDVVGDVHGCWAELTQVLGQAGYTIDDQRNDGRLRLSHPEGRILVLLGDLTDRGPASTTVLRLAMDGREDGSVYTLMGNHDWKLYRHLEGRPVKIGEALSGTLAHLASEDDAFSLRVRDFYRSVPHQIRVPLSWDHAFHGAENLWLVHAAAKAHRQGKIDSHSFERSIYGYARDDLDDLGWLQRVDWASDYEGADPVIHGHVVHRSPTMKNRVLCIDTGCVFGNQLTLYRPDTDEFFMAPAGANYAMREKVFL